MNKISSSVVAGVIAAAALAHSPISVAAEPGVCGSAVDKVAVPASWQKIVKDGIVSYRAPSSAEALTTATFEITDPVTSRTAIMRKFADVLRQTESRLGGRGVALSPVRQERYGSRLQTCWWGEHRASRRTFVSVARNWANVVQSYYYEAVGVSTSEFDQRAALIFGQSRAGSPMAVDTVRIPAFGSGAAALITLHPLLELEGR